MKIGVTDIVCRGTCDDERYLDMLDFGNRQLSSLPEFAAPGVTIDAGHLSVARWGEHLLIRGKATTLCGRIKLEFVALLTLSDINSSIVDDQVVSTYLSVWPIVDVGSVAQGRLDMQEASGLSNHDFLRLWTSAQ
ncbi:MAG: hypothetical protein WC400_03325 [Patescibacteria group bacterium]|jgi:hypothetical protein